MLRELQFSRTALLFGDVRSSDDFLVVAPIAVEVVGAARGCGEAGNGVADGHTPLPAATAMSTVVRIVVTVRTALLLLLMGISG